MVNYELVLLINPSIADEEVPQVVEKVTQFVGDYGGLMAEVKPWGRRRLAYSIDDFQEANYVYTSFQLDPAYTKELSSNLTLSEAVIRHLLVRVGSERGKGRGVRR